MARPSWDEYFMEVARAIAKRATCDRGGSGCVIAREKQLLATGYAGSPASLPHCDETGHLFKETVHPDGQTTRHCARTVHAEQNVICQAAKLGQSIAGATTYCRVTPCLTCAMLLINCGIIRVVCEYRYQAAADAEKLFAEAGVHLEYVNTEVLDCGKQDII